MVDISAFLSEGRYPAYFSPGDALCQSFMTLGLLLAEENVDTHIERQTDIHARFMFYNYRSMIYLLAPEYTAIRKMIINV